MIILYCIVVHSFDNFLIWKGVVDVDYIMHSVALHTLPHYYDKMLLIIMCNKLNLKKKILATLSSENI